MQDEEEYWKEVWEDFNRLAHCFESLMSGDTHLIEDACEIIYKHRLNEDEDEE